MNKSFTVSLIVIIAVIAISGLFFPKGREVVQNVLGSVPSPELVSTYFSVNEVVHEYRHVNWNGATSTPCSVVSPSSTSTLVHASFQVNKSTTTAVILTLATSTQMNATTSLLVPPITLGSGAKGTVVYSGTTTGSVLGAITLADVLAPNTFLTWGFEGTLGFSSTAFRGTCNAEFIVN